jgi:hypothetical protein
VKSWSSFQASVLTSLVGSFVSATTVECVTEPVVHLR